MTGDEKSVVLFIKRVCLEISPPSSSQCFTNASASRLPQGVSGVNTKARLCPSDIAISATCPASSSGDKPN